MNRCIPLAEAFRRTRNTSYIHIARQFQSSSPSSSWIQFVLIRPKFVTVKQCQQYRSLQQQVHRSCCIKSYTSYFSLSSWMNNNRQRRRMQITPRRTIYIGQLHSLNNYQPQRRLVTNYNNSHSSYSSSFIAPSEMDSTGTTYNNNQMSSNIQQQQQQTLQQQKYVVDQCQELYNSVLSFNNGIRGPLLPYSNQSVVLPMVLCVGNHSSGKSSFINYVLGRSIQTAGVAPTDDCFTIIAPNNINNENNNNNSQQKSSSSSNFNDYDQDGFAIIGNPDYGFTSLQQFGPTLQHHTVFKLRSNINANFIMVDSPGMIDAPTNYSSGLLINNGGSNHPTAGTMDRGYDFTGVVKWYADRADVVLLFFDPDKPGTTGETLSILVNALSGIDHKLIIIFNKADRFMNQQIHDFARAYGSLCWNLSKVIPRKDLPRIYTMCLPVDDASSASSSGGINTTTNIKSTHISSGLKDLNEAREEVVAQVRKAPERRLDNVITNLYDSISLLQMYARIVQDLQQRYYRFYWSCKFQEIMLFSGGTACTVGCALYGVPLLGLPVASTGILGAITILSTIGTYWYNSYSLQFWEYQNCSSTELYNIFTRLYAYEIMNGNEHIAHVWTQIRDPLSITLQPISSTRSKPKMMLNNGNNGNGTIGKLTIVTDKDLQKLHAILHDEIPKLRRLVSPTSS